jgi:hypothetical protein
MLGVRGAPRTAEGDGEQDLVVRVNDRMRRLGQKRRGAGDQPGRELGRGDEQVGRERDEKADPASVAGWRPSAAVRGEEGARPPRRDWTPVACPSSK